MVLITGLENKVEITSEKVKKKGGKRWKIETEEYYRPSSAVLTAKQ